MLKKLIPIFFIAFAINTSLLASDPNEVLLIGNHNIKKQAEQSDEEFYNEYLQQFPAFHRQMNRYVIFIPEIPQDQLENYFLEIRFGKNMHIQPCGDAKIINNFKIQKMPYKKRVNGRKVLQDVLIPLASYGDLKRSILFCSQEPDLKFVDGVGQKFLVKSTLPIVLYAPKDAKVSHRFWRAEESFIAAESFRERYLLSSIEKSTYFQEVK